MLHIVKTLQALEDASQYSGANDEWLLIEEAVYAANPLHRDFHFLKEKQVSVLEADVVARGMNNRLSPSVTLVDYSGFVRLTAAHPQTLTWD
ncbi:sulfurtransferase complex subunit TusB [Vibrio sonorensis]|uniref:sulfurtransferase complex subunit TusB n=1 Tax=Vibrio sonorensis TaxID=1004316 RepID=UPI0008DA95A6|nr:sulfurtransferase complex subunit TusB [Vibrio sonorensis]